MIAACSVQVPVRKVRVKRESGENPERYSHCVREQVHLKYHWETGKGWNL